MKPNPKAGKVEELSLKPSTVRETGHQVTALFERHHREIYVYLARLVGDEALAQDLTQEAFLKLFSQKTRLDEIENHRAWIYRIAGNLALNAIRRRDRFSWLPWRSAGRPELHSAGPEAVSDLQTAVGEALAEIPPHFRAPLLLYVQDGFNVSEIAQILGISDGAVKNRLYRAREMFRKAYDGDL